MSDSSSKTYRNWTLRAIFGSLLISYFILVVCLGPVAILLTCLVVQAKCFFEVINIGLKLYHLQELRRFRLLSLYFLVTANYFCCGESLEDYFKSNIFFSYHRAVSFMMYFTGLCLFVINLGTRHDKKQFQLLVWIHVTILLLVMQSHMVVKSILQGMIWLIVPVSVVIVNDIMAYVFGNFCGKTQLIMVSPKKTWEGYIGGGLSSLLYGFLFSHYLSQYNYFTCPLDPSNLTIITNCSPGADFEHNSFQTLFGTTLTCTPFMLHSSLISLFCSTLAPFGGFFASGFKRAFKIKDFSDTIPGHGGVLDRFDCIFLTVTFVHVYITCFVQNSSVDKYYSMFMRMSQEDQLEMFHLLQKAIIQ